MVLPATSKSPPERLIDGGSTSMPSRSASSRNSASLSVLPMSQRHRRGQELDRVVRFQIRGLIREQRIGRRVRFVEAVFGELAQAVEDRVRRGLRRCRARRALRRSGRAARPSRLDLLAHGAAQKIGLGERVAGKICADLLHLLLIGDDAVGRVQDRLELRMKVFGRLWPSLRAQ